MRKSAEILFEYMQNMFYNPGQSTLNLEDLDDDLVMLGKGLMYFAQNISQHHEFAKALAKGNLSVTPPPPENELAAPIKSLQANLRHLTWQSQQVAQGHYNQHVDFMGEFSEAFNTMIQQLAERQQQLDHEMERIQKKTRALEESNRLLSCVTQYIPQQILVLDIKKKEVLLKNNTAIIEMNKNPDYVNMLIAALAEHTTENGSCHFEIIYDFENIKRYLSVRTYLIEWNQINAEALVVDDVSTEKNEMNELRQQAHWDTMTKLYNRSYGMMILDEWLNQKRRFALAFIDLDNLKHINDEYGHLEGDIYIINVAKCLAANFRDAVVCRIGGDEFMVLVPEVDEIIAMKRMLELSKLVEYDEYLQDKAFCYGISYGIMAVGEYNIYAAGDILSKADERMYEHKRMRKRNRHRENAGSEHVEE